MKDKILIIDDDESYLLYLKKLIENKINAEVITETDAESAINRLASKEEFGIIIMDVRLPVLDGIEAAIKMRESKIDSPIIFLTGYEIKEANVNGIEKVNKSDILSKPTNSFTDSLLINKIKIFLDNSINSKKIKEKNEIRCSKIFEYAPISLWDEDISKMKEMVDSLTAEIGIENVKDYIDRNPNFVSRALKSIKIKKVNKKTLQLFEASYEEMVNGNGLEKTFTEDSYEIFKKSIIAMAKKETFFSSDVKFKTLNDKPLYTHMYIRYPDRDEDYEYVIVSMIDISAQKKLEEKSHELYSAISKSPAVVAIWKVNSDWKNSVWFPEFISDNVLELSGHSSDEFVNKMATWRSLIHEDDIKNYIIDLEKHIANKDKEFVQQYRINTRSGSIKWIKALVNPSYDHNLNFYSIQAVFSDITPEISLHNKLLESSNKWRALIESTKTAYFILNAKGTIIDCNKTMTDMLGCENCDLIGINPRTIICPSDIKKYDDAISKLFIGESIENLELCVGGNSSFETKVAWISINAGLIENGEKKIFCLVRDITESKIDEVKKYIDGQKQKDKLKQNISRIREKIIEMKGKR